MFDQHEVDNNLISLKKQKLQLTDCDKFLNKPQDDIGLCIILCMPVIISSM